MQTASLTMRFADDISEFPQLGLVKDLHESNGRSGILYENITESSGLRLNVEPEHSIIRCFQSIKSNYAMLRVEKYKEKEEIIIVPLPSS